MSLAVPAERNTVVMLVVFILVFFVSFSQAEEATVTDGDSSGNSEYMEDIYQLKAGDVLSVSVWDEPDLQREVLVLPDRTIAFPLVGVLSVNGMGVEALAQALKAGLERYIPDANVHVAVQQVRGNVVYVLGKVNRPGEYPASANLSVLQALSKAGGLATFASEDDIKIIRKQADGQEALDFIYSDIATGESLELNITLQSGDVVLVP